MHVFFKLPRPVDIPLESDGPFLPTLYVIFSKLNKGEYLYAVTDTALQLVHREVHIIGSNPKVTDQSLILLPLLTFNL